MFTAALGGEGNPYEAMKIALVITRADDLGGAQVHVADLAGALALRGHDVSVLAGGGGILFERLAGRGVHCRQLRHLVHPLRPVADGAAFFELRRVLAEMAPDVVATHSNKAGFLGRLAARSLGIPALHTSHGFLFSGREKSFAGRIYRLAESLAARAGTFLIAVCQEEARLASEFRITAPEKLAMVYNGLDPGGPQWGEREEAGKAEEAREVGEAAGGQAGEERREHGERREQGETGERREQGEQRTFRETGEQGEKQGEHGERKAQEERRTFRETGEQGEQRAQGETGEKQGAQAERRTCGVTGEQGAHGERREQEEQRTFRETGEQQGAQGDPRLVMVARFAPPKDQATLLRALAGLKSRPWLLHLVGRGPQLEEVRQLAGELGLTTRVSFLGHRDDVPLLLARSDVLVLSSRREGFPLTVLEGMRAGLPVVASRVGGVAEAVVEGKTGLLFPPGDADALQQALQRLLEDPPLACRLGEGGRRRFLKHFTLEEMVAKTEALYALAMQARGRGRS